MKPRKSALIIPESKQYFLVDVPGKGQHHFKNPYYGVGGALLNMGAKFSNLPTMSEQDQAIALLPCAGAYIGFCWKNRGLELETPLPVGGLSPEILEEYGNKVAEELQDADYDLLEIIRLLGEVTPELLKRQSVIAMADKLASFTEPPKDDSISSSSS